MFKIKLLKFIAAKNNVIVMDLSDLKTSLQKMAEVLKRDVDIFPFDDRVLAQDSVAMMARFVYRIFSIGMVMPYFVGKKLELVVAGPVVKPVF